MDIVCEILGWLGGAIAWSAGSFGAPILTGAAAGLAVPLAFRLESTPAEVRQHNREVLDLTEDFRRFMSDLARQVQLTFRKAQGEMRVEEIKANVAEDSDDVELRDALQAMANKHRWEREVKEAMDDALWRYRDEALRKRGKFIQIVESESKRHEWRRRRKQSYPVLAISLEARQALESWRSRPNPFSSEGDDDPLLAEYDPTATERDLLAFEKDEGLTWDAAKAAILSADR